MIETKSQAIKAFTEIKNKTDWSLREIARQSGIEPATLSRLMNGQRSVKKQTMINLFNLQMRVRGME